MDYLNVSKNSKCSKIFAKTHVIFSSYVVNKRNRKKILVLTEDMRIYVLAGSSYVKKQEIPVAHIRQVSASPGRDQVIVLHVTRREKDSKDVLCAFLDENRCNFTGEEIVSRLDIFVHLLKTQLTKFDNTFNTDEYFNTASKIHVYGKRKAYKLKFVCTSFPRHTDYLMFDIIGDIIKYNVPVLFGKQNRIQRTNGMEDSNVGENDEPPLKMDPYLQR